MKRELKDKSRKYLLFIVSGLSILVLFAIYYYTIKEAIPGFKAFGLEFILSREWYPVWDPPEFGMLALLVNTLLVTFFGSIIVVPLGYLLAIYLHGYARRKEKEIIRRFIEYLSGIPSVVVAAIFLTWVSPLFPKIGIYSPLNISLAVGGLVVLTIPLATILILESLDSVPRELEESSAALGAKEWKTYTKITTKAAFSGILNTIVLTANRLAGETIVVVLLGGGAAMIPITPFDPMKTLTAAIASEMPETAQYSTHYHALFVAGALLIGISTIFEITSVYISRRRKR